jgi:hypothetical protein
MKTLLAQAKTFSNKKKTIIQGKVDSAIGARFKTLQEEKTFNDFTIDLLNAYEERSKLKSASKPEIYSFFNDMAKDGKCVICNGNTWLKRCIGQKNEDGSKSYFHEKCWEELKWEEDPELYKLGRRLREIKTEIAQGQKLLKDIDKQTVLADLKTFLMKVGKEGGFSVSKEEHYQLLSIVTKLEKPAEPMKTEPLIEDKGYTFIQKLRIPLQKVNRF